MIPSRDLLKWIERIALDSYARGYAAGLEVDEQRREAVLAEVWERIKDSGGVEGSNTETRSERPIARVYARNGRRSAESARHCVPLAGVASGPLSPIKNSGGVESRHAGVAPREGTVPVEAGGPCLMATGSNVGSNPTSRSRSRARPAVSNVVAIHERRPDGKWHL